MSNPTHLIGFDNGYFKVIEYFGKDPKRGGYLWTCECRCQRKLVLRTDILKSRSYKSCGCLRKGYENGFLPTKNFSIKHGLSKGGKKHPLYKTWESMKKRCYNSTQNDYPAYQGKGIIVCDEWLKDAGNFFNWAMNNGWKKGLTIDRIDPEKNYTPENCQFLTRSENSKKSRKQNPMKEHYANYKIREKQRDQLMHMLKAGINKHQIAKQLNISLGSVYRVIKKYLLQKGD